MRRVWPWLIIGLVSLIPLLPTIIAGEALGPWRQINSMVPWMNSPVPDGEVWDVLQADGCLQFTAWRDLLFEKIRTGGDLARNEYVFGGAPFAATSQTGAYYPLHHVVARMNIPTPQAMILLAWLHLAWAGCGVMMLARKWGAGLFGAVVAGCGFALSPFMASWLVLASVPTTVAWIPWLWLFVSGADGLKWKPWQEALGAGASLVMLILAGHLQFAAFGIMGATILLVARWLSSDRKVAALVTVGLLIGGLCVYPVLKPSFELAARSHRHNTPTAEGYEAYRRGGMSLDEVAGIIEPTLLGSPRQSARDSSHPQLSAYWPALTRPGANFAEESWGLGWVVTLLLLASITSADPAISRKEALRNAPILLLGLFGLLVAVASLVAAALYFWLPGWSSTGSPARAGILFLIAFLVAFAIQVDKMVDEPPKANLRTFVAFGMIALIVALTYARHPVSLIGPVILGILALVIAQKVKPSVRRVLIAVAVLGSMILAAPQVPHGPLPTAPKYRPAGMVAVLNNHWNLYEVPRATLPPNLLTLFRIREIGGYDSLIERSTVEKLKVANGQDPAPPENGNMMFVKSTADFDRLADLGVTEVWADHQIDDRFQNVEGNLWVCPQKNLKKPR